MNDKQKFSKFKKAFSFLIKPLKKGFIKKIHVKANFKIQFKSNHAFL